MSAVLRESFLSKHFFNPLHYGIYLPIIGTDPIICNIGTFFEIGLAKKKKKCRKDISIYYEKKSLDRKM